MKRFLILPLMAVLLVSQPVKAGANDTYIPESQQELCKTIGAEYGIQPELLEAIIEQESAGKMSATNGSCYGICQINGAVHGYGYDTEEKQIRKACEILLYYDCEVAEALGHYNGQKEVHYDGYVDEVLTRSHELEIIHYGN